MRAHPTGSLPLSAPPASSPATGRAGRAVGGWRRGALLGLGSILLSAGCGDDEIPPTPIPDAEETRQYFGLTDGSCIRYRFAQSGATLFATASVLGPDLASVAGREVYRWQFLLPQSTQPVDEWLIEAQDDGELRLLRAIDGSGQSGRVTRTYTCFGDDCPPADETEPQLLGLEYEDDQPALPLGSTFQVTTTPEISTGTSEPEEHTVVVQNEIMVTPPRATEPVLAKEVAYQVRRGTGASRNMVFDLVPGQGFATVQDGPVVYTACDWRVCDLDGNCQGASSCAELSCN